MPYPLLPSAMAALINGLYSLLFLAIFFLVFPPSGTLIHFKFSRFDLDTKNIVYEGDATPFYRSIELSLPAYASRVGWATYAEKLPLRDSDTRRLFDFNTQFSFMVDPLNSSTYGQAIAFSLLQWVSKSLRTHLVASWGYLTPQLLSYHHLRLL